MKRAWWLALIFLPAAALGQPASEDALWIKGDGVSVKRPGGKIVAWALPEAQSRFGRAGLQAIVAAADRDLRSLGVDTRFVIFTGKRLSREAADAQGKLVMLGSKKSVVALAPANGLVSAEDAAWLERQWSPEGSNPELSDYDLHGKGKYSMVGVDACWAFAKESAGALTPAEAAALFSIHGVGHQAGIGIGGPHPAEENFMDDGARLLSMLNGKLYVSGGVGVQLRKRPAAELFRASAFENGTAYLEHDGPKQKEQWLAAFAPR
jgi:hypothetical protein